MSFDGLNASFKRERTRVTIRHGGESVGLSVWSRSVHSMAATIVEIDFVHDQKFPEVLSLYS